MMTVRATGRVGIGTTNPGSRFVVTNGVTDRFAVRDADNNLYAFGAWQSAWSDKRLKENVAVLKNMLDRVLKISPVSFQWKKEAKLDDSMHYGVIAQELREVFPSLVYEDKDGHLNVRRDELQFVLIQAIKEQQQQIDRLKKEVAELKKR